LGSEFSKGRTFIHNLKKAPWLREQLEGGAVQALADQRPQKTKMSDDWKEGGMLLTT